MNKQEFTEVIERNEGLELRQKNLVRVGRHGNGFIPVACEVVEQEDWKGNKRNVTTFKVQAFHVDDNLNIVLGNVLTRRPRDVEWSWNTVGMVADEIVNKRVTNSLYCELRDNSAWSPNPDDFDSPYLYERRAEDALSQVIAQAVKDAGMVTSERPVGVLVGDHVTVSFTMTLTEAKALLNQKASV